MRHIRILGQSFLHDEKAAEVTELAVVLALIVAGSISLIAAIGVKVEGLYKTFDTDLQL